tara:strand:+ start:903 stop:1778 length:876 start_codon:yes stop_codon:yes gene_type:complete
LEVYECDTQDKNKFEEICGIRQPVIFNYSDYELQEYCVMNVLIEKYSSFDFKIRNVNRNILDEEELYIPLKLSDLHNVFQRDKEGRYITERNAEFLEETGLVKHFKYNDSLIRPYMSVSREYDLMTGSVTTSTPFRYNLHYRSYFSVITGNIKIIMAPPKYSKFLHEVKDYDNYEFRSEINPWSVSKEHKTDFDKIKCLKVDLTVGQLIYIPAYWWYSIEYSENTIVAGYKYHTYMSMLSISHHNILALLQSQNIKRNPYLNIIKDTTINVDSDNNCDSLTNIVNKSSKED